MSSVSVAAAALIALAAPAIEGDWLTADGKAIVSIASCGPRMCGRVVQILARGPKVPTTDVRNPDPKLRSRPLVGLPVLTGFARSGVGWSGGRAYDAKTGRIYEAKLTPNADGSLTVTGCVLFLCKSQRWTRAR